MEIQIPVAEQDTGTESLLQTERSDPTLSHVSESARTARSCAHSGVSLPALQSMAEHEGEEGAEEAQTDRVQGHGSGEDTETPTGGQRNRMDTPRPGAWVSSGLMEGEDGGHTAAKPGGEDQTSKDETHTSSAPGKQAGDDAEGPATPQENFAGDGDEQSHPDSTASHPNTNSGSAADVGTTDNPQVTDSLSGGSTRRTEPVFLTENHRHEEEGSDISDTRAETPDWREERDGDSVSDEGGVSHRLGQSSLASHVRPLTRSTLHDDVGPGQRAVVNTPVSYYTATDVNAEVRNLESRNTSHAGQETVREAAFQRAMTLMTSRCDSSSQGTGGVGVALGGLLGVSSDATFGPKFPQYFYVHQRKPTPMSPLKVWKGYHGNVYFEPMRINSVGAKGGAGDPRMAPNPAPSVQSRKSSGSRGRTLTATTRSQALVPVGNGGNRDNMTQGGGQSPTRSSKSLAVRRAATSAKSKASSQSVGTISQHHVLYLDKEAILSSDNSTMHEELQVLEKQQSTGSLNIQPRSSFPATNFPAPGGSTAGKVEGRRSGAKSAKFDRICKGSVVHKLRRAKSGGLLGNSMARGRQNRGGEASKAASSSSLVVVGDKFASPNVMSPLLRTQTQFSLSSQRMTMNSPDLYAAFERLPPLEQVRISLRQMDSHPEDGYIARGATPYSTTTSVGVVEELKPLVKYSPDVRAQYNRQIKYY